MAIYASDSHANSRARAAARCHPSARPDTADSGQPQPFPVTLGSFNGRSDALTADLPHRCRHRRWGTAPPYYPSRPAPLRHRPAHQSGRAESAGTTRHDPPAPNPPNRNPADMPDASTPSTAPTPTPTPDPRPAPAHQPAAAQSPAAPDHPATETTPQPAPVRPDLPQHLSSYGDDIAMRPSEGRMCSPNLRSWCPCGGLDTCAGSRRAGAVTQVPSESSQRTRSSAAMTAGSSGRPQAFAVVALGGGS